jgi:hypothetical protein
VRCGTAIARSSNLILNILVTPNVAERVTAVAATGVDVAEARVVLHDLRLDLDGRSLPLGDATGLDAYF